MSVQYSGEPNPRTMFLEGPFGAGKTSFAIETLFAWLEAGILPEQILVLVPQRTLARRFTLALRDIEKGPRGYLDVRTMGGLAKDAVNLYWPVVAQELRIPQPELAPRFLTIETSQYAMAGFVSEAVERGEFDAISISPQQIARQIIDSLGKAALMGVSYREVQGLLAAAWGPERPRKRLLAYESAARVAAAYRDYCIQNRLLDYSLQIEGFARLLTRADFRKWFFGQHRYLVAEHVEEEQPLTHRVLTEWLPQLEGALLTYEWDSGYRFVLGADAEGGYRLRNLCEGIMEFNRSFITTAAVDALHREVRYSFGRTDEPAPENARLAFTYRFNRFYPEMLEWVADQIERLITLEEVPPREIAILSPYLSDAVRFSLTQKLEERGVPTLSHRPSRALRDEPAARTLLSLAALAHPQWDQPPPFHDVADTLQTAVTGLDPVRARLLAKVVYRPHGDAWLTPFEAINAPMQARITYQAGQRYDVLRNWLLAYIAAPPQPLDFFFSRLFGEVLSQPGFGFHADQEAGRITAELVESARKFRQALFDEGSDPNLIGRQYLQIVRQGLLAALYVASWRDELADAVFMAPAYTFLMRNRPVTVQFWLDVGSIGWWERLEQPLTHPYVLTPSWEPGMIWTDHDEFTRQEEMLFRVLSGLLRRCRREVYLGITDLGEQGLEQRGPMLRIFQQILRRHPLPPGA